MSESELLLGIDIGTTHIKALLAGPDGHVASVSKSQTPFETVNAGSRCRSTPCVLRSLQPSRRWAMSDGG